MHRKLNITECGILVAGIKQHRENDNYYVFIPIKEDGVTNNTRVRCKIIYKGSNDPNQVSSLNSNTQGIITIQGQGTGE
jgi:hypothetical protein